MIDDLADQFVEATYKIPGRLARMNWAKKQDMERVMLTYRAVLRRANRFILSDDFVEMATAISTTTMPDKLLARLPLAILPYETTWIEFDQHVMVAAILRTAQKNQTLDKSKVAKQGGLLLQRNINRETSWSMTNVSHMDIGGEPIVFPHPASVVFDETATPEPFGGHSAISKIDTDTGDMTAMTSRAFRAAPWGYDVGAKRADFDRWATVFKPDDPLYNLMQRATPTISPLFSHTYASMKGGQTRKVVESLSNLIAFDQDEHRGLLRWTVTILALLSDVPLIMSEHKQRPGVRLVGTIDRPYFDYHRLSIKLPKVAHKVRYLEKRMDREVARRHRQHQVRSHWRTYLTAIRCLRDQHEWIYDDDLHNKRHCERCRSHSTRISEHSRGDPSLGTVHKTYILEANKGVI